MVIYIYIYILERARTYPCAESPVLTFVDLTFVGPMQPLFTVFDSAFDPNPNHPTLILTLDFDSDSDPHSPIPILPCPIWRAGFELDSGRGAGFELESWI